MAGEKNVHAQDINQLLKVRRDKLKDLQDNGKDPFVITKYDVTHHSRKLRITLKHWKVRTYLWLAVSCPNVLWEKPHSVISRTYRE